MVTPQETIERALSIAARIAGVEGCVAIADENSSANVRWANNTLTTNGVTRGRRLAVVTTLDGAEGTATGVRQANKGNQVKVVSFDAGPNQVKALKEGTVQALVAQQPQTIGQYGVDMAVAALDGVTVTPKVQTGFTIITKDNVDGDAADAVYKSSC